MQCPSSFFAWLLSLSLFLSFILYAVPSSVCTTTIFHLSLIHSSSFTFSLSHSSSIALFTFSLPHCYYSFVLTTILFLSFTYVSSLLCFNFSASLSFSLRCSYSFCPITLSSNYIQNFPLSFSNTRCTKEVLYISACFSCFFFNYFYTLFCNIFALLFSL